MANRQTLIHLHGTGRLEDASKLNLGEIAVRNAATAADTELAVLTSGSALVYIPSIDKVTGITDTISKSLESVDSRVDALEGKLSGTTSNVSDQITTALDALDYNESVTSDDGKAKVTVSITQVDGHITAHTVSTTDVASAQDLADTNTALDAVKETADSAVQNVIVANTATNNITATKSAANVVELNFDNMVIDCGTY